MKENKSVLKRLHEENVVTFSMNEDGTKLIAVDGCDAWFWYELSPKKVRRLAHELLELAKLMAPAEMSVKNE